MKRFAFALALALALTGCFKRDAGPAEAIDATGGVTLDDDKADEVAALAAARPQRYSFGAVGAPVTTAWFNGSIGSEANAAIESAQDRGGTSWGTIVRSEDFSAFVPAGQPTLVEMRLWYDNKPGASVDLDPYVAAFGAVSHESHEYADEMTWTLPVKTKTVATIGGLEPTLLGVQAANGRIAPGSSVPFWMRVDFRYGSEVAAANVPYALKLPVNASGFVVESVKFSGDTHVQGRFLVVSPDDELVAAVEFDDIAIPTQSVYVAAPGPGEYVFYVVDVHNGFFAVSADAPLDDVVARPLARVVTDSMLLRDPVVPGGVAEHWVDAPVTPYAEATSATFSIDGAFPLEVEPVLASGTTGDVELRVTNANGLVASYHRFARHDAAEGTIGVSDEDIEENRRFDPALLARGEHSLSAVVNGMQGEAGVRVVTYAR